MSLPSLKLVGYLHQLVGFLLRPSQRVERMLGGGGAGAGDDGEEFL